MFVFLFFQKYTKYTRAYILIAVYIFIFFYLKIKKIVSISTEFYL